MSIELEKICRACKEVANVDSIPAEMPITTY